MSWSERIVDDCGYELELQAERFERAQDKLILELQVANKKIIELQLENARLRGRWVDESDSST